MTGVVQSFRLMMVGIALVAVLSAGNLASAAPYAAIVMDMRDGKVLHARSADRPQHPASLTKMMTLYLTFEALETGQLRLDQKVRVSRKAARMPASKLYLKAGQRVTIRSLIRATAIKSANDAAMVLAETIGGSQKAFARLMTKKAKALGMTKTTFQNPHGLTQNGHLSTARDMALLARHLYFDFPDYYNVFGKRTHTAAGKRIYTTNRLLGTYRGAEGMKTGYTRAAGYNLVAVARRGTKRVIAVVMGGKSSRSRNGQVAKLLDMGFSRADQYVAEVKPSVSNLLVASAPVPQRRPGVPATGIAAIADAISVPAAVAAIVPTESAAPLYTAPPMAQNAQKPTEKAGLASSAKPTARAADELLELARATGTVVPPRRPKWSVQIGAYEDRDLAVANLTSITLGDLASLSTATPAIGEVVGRRGKLYTVKFEGFAPNDARAACKDLKRHGKDCIALAPERL